MGGRGSASIQSENARSTRERAESVLQSMRDAGMKPVKSVEETMKIIERHDKQNKILDKQYKAELQKIYKDRSARQKEQKKYEPQNEQVRKTMLEARKLATAGKYKESQKVINQAKALNDKIPANNRVWNTDLTPKKLDVRDLK